MNIIDRLVKKFNSEDVIKFSDKDGFKEMKSWAHTGSSELDFNMGTFGLPATIVEIAGVSKSGKTTIGLQSMANFQRENPETAVCVILSSESRDNKSYAKQLSVDTDNVLIIKIRYVEEAFLKMKSVITEATEAFKEIGKKPKFFFLWDSLGATLSKAEVNTADENLKLLEKAIEKGDGTLDDLKNDKVGAFAKEAKKFAKYIVSESYSHVLHFCILNHTYDTIGYGVSTKKSTGGAWIEFFPAIRLQTSLRQTLKVDDVDLAQISTVKIIKNDFGGRKKTDIRILFGYGIILSDEDIEYAIENGILQKDKSKFIYKDISWRTDKQLYSIYSEKNNTMRELEREISESRRKDLLILKEKYENIE